MLKTKITSAEEFLRRLKYYGFSKATVEDKGYSYKIRLSSNLKNLDYEILLTSIEKHLNIDKDYYVFKDLKWFNNFFVPFKLK
jgi:hypothetical protein